MKALVIILVSVGLITGCTSSPPKPPKPKYESYWDKSAVAQSQREMLELECELLGFDAREEYRKANPVVRSSREGTILGIQSRDKRAAKFGRKAERACLTSKGYIRKERCVRNC